MKYFIDTEFIEGFKKHLFGKRRHFIDLISIGVVCEDGRTYHAISNEFRYRDADDWVKENVIVPLYINTVHGDMRNRYDADNFQFAYGKSNKQIAAELEDFILRFHTSDNIKRETVDCENGNPIEFYGYYADYDWVLFCSLFGRMIDLPKGFPMYCKDLKQMLDEKVSGLSNSDFFTKFHIKEEMSLGEKLTEIKKHTQYPQQQNEHNALDDAKWNRYLYNFITQTLNPNP